MDIRTKCIHNKSSNYDSTGAVSMPIYQSATFAHPAVHESTGFDYSRLQNPTREKLEKTVASLEGGADALAFSSGMAAVAALMELFSPGDHIIVSEDLYGGSHRLFQHISRKNGLTFRFLDTSDEAGLERQITPATKAVFLETPTNPMMRVSDIAAISAVTKRHGLLLIVDNTFLTPYFQRPLELGADLVVHSGTKYLCGHNDTLAGFVVTADDSLSEKLRFLHKTTGAALAPFDSWLLLRGLKTLAVRLEKQQENALQIARWLKTAPKVREVFYVGLPEHPQYEISRRQASGFGAMISFQVDSRQTAENLLNRVGLIQYAESLGGVESLITYPMLQTHADMSESERERNGIGDRLLRLSVGLEYVGDLLDDLARALED